MSKKTRGIRVGRFAQWLSLKIARRTPRDTRFVLSQRNIYIFPSRAGFAFLALLLLMLLTAINYQSSMVYLLTFILAAVFFVSIWLCFFNLLGLELEAQSTNGCFAGSPVDFVFRAVHPTKSLFGLSFFIDADAKHRLDLEAGVVTSVKLQGGVYPRGVARFERLCLQTSFPFGLMQAWSWLPLDCTAVVYPKPLSMDETVTGAGDDEQVQELSVSSHADSLRPYRDGDALARVHWKKYAATDALLVKDQQSGSSVGDCLNWQDFEHYGLELALSYMCKLFIDGLDQGHAVGLDLPGVLIPPAQGLAHRHRGLEALARFGLVEG